MEKTDSSPLSRQALYADKKQWNQFLSSFFIWQWALGFTVAGIIFFFAYNWEELPKFAKLGIVEVLLVASVLLATFTHWNKLVKQILLTGATFLIGTLFAVFGQIYQTGADAYDLFLGMDSFHHSLGGCYPFRSVVADVHRITLYLRYGCTIYR
mgnify:CR=1 FL=1